MVWEDLVAFQSTCPLDTSCLETHLPFWLPRELTSIKRAERIDKDSGSELVRRSIVPELAAYKTWTMSQKGTAIVPELAAYKTWTMSQKGTAKKQRARVLFKK